MSNLNVYKSNKLDLYDNWIEFKDFFKSLKGYAAWWFFLNIMALIILVLLPFKNPTEEKMRYLMYMLELNKEDPYYYHMLLFTAQLAKPVIFGLVLLNYYFLCLIIAFFLRPLINLLVQVLYQSFVDKNPDEYINLKNHYHSIFNAKLKPILRGVISIPSLIIVIIIGRLVYIEYQSNTVLSEEFLKETFSAIFLTLILFALFIEILQWILLLRWRKKEILTLYRKFDIFLFSKYTIKDKFKSFLNILLYLGILIHYLLPMTFKSTDIIKVHIDVKYLKVYTSLYNTYYEEQYSKYTDEQKESFIGFSPNNLYIGDIKMPNPFESIKYNEDFKNKIINNLFYLFIYIGILNLTIILFLKVLYYRKYFIVFLTALLNSIKYCSIFTLIGIILIKFFSISMSNPVSIGNLFLILVSFLLSIGQYEDFSIKI